MLHFIIVQIFRTYLSVKWQSVTKDKIEFLVYCSLLCLDSKILIYHFLLSPKYNIFWSENLHTYRIQHCLRHDIFFEFFLDVQNFKGLKFKLHWARAPNGRSQKLQMEIGTREPDPFFSSLKFKKIEYKYLIIIL
jgi:hypothetical protein